MFWVVTHFFYSCHLICDSQALTNSYRTSLYCRLTHLIDSSLISELSELPLVRLDVSCNRISQVPVCYRHLRHLQNIILDNNPLQMPPAQICSKGKFHIFKYLNMEACKRTQDQFEKALRPTAFNSWWGIVKDERSQGVEKFELPLSVKTLLMLLFMCVVSAVWIRTCSPGSMVAWIPALTVWTAVAKDGQEMRYKELLF